LGIGGGAVGASLLASAVTGRGSVESGRRFGGVKFEEVGE